MSSAPVPLTTRVPGHALSLTWSGEYGVESSSTGTCKCGRWQESASSQREVRFEYREHLRKVRETLQSPETPATATTTPDTL